MKTLTPGEIASYCDVHQRTVSRWIANGVLKGFQLPGRGNYRVLQSDFLDFLSEQQMPIPQDLRHDNTVLIVDDEQQMRHSLSRLFHQLGYTIHLAANGFEAGTMLHNKQPSLVTLDLRMPGLDGYQVLSYIRQQPELKNTKVLVISGLGSEELEQARQLGADAVLAKGFAHKKVIQLLQALGLPANERV